MSTAIRRSATEAAPAGRAVSPDEWRVRVDLAAAYRLVAHFGWDDLTYTHLSARVPGTEDQFLINPYGMLFNEITASSLVKIDLDGNKIEPSDYGVNPAGFTIHSAVHQTRHDAHCVMHLHTRCGTAVSTHAAGLMPLNQTALVVIPHIGYHDYEGIAFNHDERPRLARDLGDKWGLILRNHGTLAVGTSVPNAFLFLYLIERACEMQVATLAGGVPLHMPSPEAQDTVRRQVARPLGEAGGLNWPGLLRLLDKVNPGYDA